jgi:lipopolysaccharide export system permease protein
VAILFAVSFTIGNFYSRNELTVVFSSGVPLFRFTLVLVLFGIAASFFSFYFQDLVVVPTFRQKNELSRTLLRQRQTEYNTDIVVRARNGTLVYSVDYFDSAGPSLVGLSLIQRDETGTFLALIRAPQATWQEDHWALDSPLLYGWQGELLRVSDYVDTGDFSESPDTFRRSSINVDDLPVKELDGLIGDLAAAGLPYAEAQADYYRRFSFSVTPLVVILLSIPLGGWFRKNVLLMSLVASLALAALYYILEMITMLFARMGYVSPIAGAWFPVGFFIFIGLVLQRFSKT